jgi:hypothetical protein
VLKEVQENDSAEHLSQRQNASGTEVIQRENLLAQQRTDSSRFSADDTGRARALQHRTDLLSRVRAIDTAKYKNAAPRLLAVGLHDWNWNVRRTRSIALQTKRR